MFCFKVLRLLYFLTLLPLLAFSTLIVRDKHRAEVRQLGLLPPSVWHFMSPVFVFFPHPPDESGTSPAGEGLAHQSFSRHTPGNESGGRKRGEHMFNERVRLRRFAYRRAIGLLQKTVGIKPESVHGWRVRGRERSPFKAAWFLFGCAGRDGASC